MKDRLDGAQGARLGPRALDLGDMKKGRALETDVEEGALHARKHAHDLSVVDVADEAAGARALNENVLENPVL